MRASFSFLVLALASCSLPLAPISAPYQPRPEETIIVGRIELIPPLGPDEQRLYQRYRDVRMRGQAFLIASREKKSAWSAADLGVQAGARSVPVPLGETFFIKAYKAPVYLALGLVVMEARGEPNFVVTGPQSRIFQRTLALPGGIELEIRPGDRAIYIGTLQYYRNELGEILLVEVKNEYEEAQKQFHSRFGEGLTLRPALAATPALDPKILAKYGSPQIPPKAERAAPPSPGTGEVSLPPDAPAPPETGAPSASSASEEALAAGALLPPLSGEGVAPSPTVRLQQSAGGGLFTYDAPLLTTPHPGVPEKKAEGTTEKEEILDLSEYYRKSSLAAFALSLGSSAAGLGLLYPSLLGKNGVATAISVGLLTIGPSAGHFYAGEDERALLTSVVRLVVGAASIIDFNRRGGFTEINSLIFLSLLTAGGLEILDAPRAVQRRKARMRKVRLVSLSPAPTAPEEGQGGFVVQVGGEF